MHGAGASTSGYDIQPDANMGDAEACALLPSHSDPMCCLIVKLTWSISSASAWVRASAQRVADSDQW